MIAGGTGFAPLKSMLRHVLENGIRRAMHLYWGARHRRDLYEEAQVLEWVRALPAAAASPRCSPRPARREAAHQRARLGARGGAAPITRGSQAARYTRPDRRR